MGHLREPAKVVAVRSISQARQRPSWVIQQAVQDLIQEEAVAEAGNVIPDKSR